MGKRRRKEGERERGIDRKNPSFILLILF